MDINPIKLNRRQVMNHKISPSIFIKKLFLYVSMSAILVFVCSPSASAAEYFHLQARHSGKCLNQHGATQGNGDGITQWDCVNAPNLTVEKTPADQGYFFLKFQHSGKCVHLHGGSSANGAPITQWDCINQPNLKWREEPAGDGYSYIRSAQTNKCLQVQGGATGNGDSITQWDCINQPNVQWKFIPVVTIGAVQRDVATQKSQIPATLAAIKGAPGPYYATPSWDQTFPCTTITNCPRFLVLSNMGSAAVLDKETGLVWESTPNGIGNWYAAQQYCVNAFVGNRKGWRLPMVHELMSLVERPSEGLALPPGHPFNEVVKKPWWDKQQKQSAFYWSATTAAVPNTTSQAWGVDFINWGNSVNVDKYSGNGFAWCVRGGTDVNP
jgi:hypothetical protein